MRTLVLMVLLSGSLQHVFGQSYEYTLDLTNVVDDKVQVTLTLSGIKQNEINFYVPKIIPGTYAVADYGRLITDVKAFDKKGNALPVNKVEENTWKISNSKRLHTLSYWVNDSFDAELEENQIFWPAGTNIEKSKNFVINSAGFFGYFDGLKDRPVQFTIVRDKSLYGATGLIPVKQGEKVPNIKLEIPPNDDARVDVFLAEDYDHLIDCPLMYAEPDTAIIKVANTEVLISSYSPNRKISAAEIAATIREVLMAQKEYLGGKLPVDKYAFIFYFTDKPVNSYGALEHSYSSFYYMPETTIDKMRQQLRDFAAHEFFHIVTPLTIHSEEIDRFDFNDPKMSQHLWLYEGVTEYFAGNVQVKYGLISQEQYLHLLRNKLLIADQFKDDFIFTEFSKQVLDHQDYFYNVYQKGALIGMCLDIKLLQLSDGKYGLQNLILELSEKFGKDRPFKDDELFDTIEKLTYPEIGAFLRTHVSGSTPLPIKELFDLVGIDYTHEKVGTKLSLGLTNSAIKIFDFDEKKMLGIGNPDKLDDQGKKFGFKDGDVIISMNGVKLPEVGGKLHEVINQQQAYLQAGNEFSYEVSRQMDDGNRALVTVKAVISPIGTVERHILSYKSSPPDHELKLRRTWISTK